MYNENDLKNFWYAYKGGITKSQLSQLFSISETEANNMLTAAQERFGGIRPSKARPYHFQSAISQETKKPFQRPPAKYDNKSQEERINEYLNPEI